MRTFRNVILQEMLPDTSGQSEWRHKRAYDAADPRALDQERRLLIHYLRVQRHLLTLQRYGLGPEDQMPPGAKMVKESEIPPIDPPLPHCRNGARHHNDTINIRRAQRLRAAGASMKEIAHRLGCSLSTAGYWSRGLRTPKAKKYTKRKRQ